MCVDVSWISPYPDEQEIIMDIRGTAIIEPTQLLSQQDCKCSQQLTCPHSIERYLENSKVVLVDLLYPNWFVPEETIMFLSILKKGLLNFSKQLQNHKSV